MIQGWTDGQSPPVDFKLLFESAPGLYLVLDPDFRIVAASETYLAATLTRRKEILGRHVFEVFPDNPADPAATGVANLRESLDRALTLRVPDAMAPQKYDIQRPQLEGGGFEERYWSPINTPVISTTGEVVYLIHQVEDITEYVRLKEAQFAQAEVHEALRGKAVRLEAEILRRAQELQEANKELRTLKELLERRVEERTDALTRTNEALSQREEQLRQAQKMEAVGRLAGGIAHDFNNLLTVILGAVDLARSGINADQNLEAIQFAGEQAARLTRQLLAFSRKQVVSPQVIDLNHAVNASALILSRLIREDIDLELRTAEGLRQISADPSHVEQVILNLAINACDAMPRGGRLVIETANGDVDEGFAQAHPGASPGSYAVLSVADTGIGMDPSVQAKVFEPFFTTKEQGRGTGLGLSTVLGIVQQSHGFIHLESSLGAGSSFRIFFPEASPRAQPAPDPEAGWSARGGGETILLVEDDDQVRAIAAAALRASGYSLLEARNGAEAIKICREYDQEIHLLLSDVVMPEAGGRLVSEAVRLLRPRMAVVLMSGYTDDRLIQHQLLDTQLLFLQKPFTPAKLRKVVREALARR